MKKLPTSAKKHKELRRKRIPNNILIHSPKMHKINKYNVDGGINPDWTRLQELKKNMAEKNKV